MANRIFTILIISTATSLCSAQEIPSNTLPDGYSGEALFFMKPNQDSEFIIGSKQTFFTSIEWEIKTSSLFHSEELGYTTTNYSYSSPPLSFRYNYQGSMKTVHYIDKKLIDRDPFISPRKGYDLLSNSQNDSIETTDNGLVVYSRKDPTSNNQLTFIAVEEPTGQIHWMENRSPDGSSLQRFEYSKWISVDDDHWVPTLIRFDADTIYEIKSQISNISLLSTATPPKPKDLGDNFVVFDAEKNETFYPNGESLGKAQLANKPAPQKKNNTAQRLTIGFGVTLIFLSGAIIYKRRVGTS